MSKEDFEQNKEALTNIITSTILNILEDLGPEKTREISWFSQDINKISKENKQMVTLRIDADVLKFFKNSGRFYQRRINQVLKQFMENSQKEPNNVKLSNSF